MVVRGLWVAMSEQSGSRQPDCERRRFGRLGNQFPSTLCDEPWLSAKVHYWRLPAPSRFQFDILMVGRLAKQL